MAFLFPSYFPFCIYEGNDYEVGAGTAWPVGMSLEEAMFLYWKVKSFTLVENWNTQGFAPGGSAHVVGTTNTTMTALGNKMSDLICTIPYQTLSTLSGIFIWTNPYTDPPNEPANKQDTIGLDLFVGFPQIIKIGSIYYPGIYYYRDTGYGYRWSSLAIENDGFTYMASMRLGDLTGDPYSIPVYGDNLYTTYTNTYSNFTANAQRIAE